MKILIQHGDQRLGPYTDAEARAALGSGLVRPGDLAWREGSATWIPLAGLLARPAGLIGAPALPKAATPQIPGLAIASFALGIGSFLCFVTGIPAIIVGHMARAQIRASHGKLTGSGFALAGLIMGYVGTCLVGLSLFISLILPAFFSAGERGREAIRMNTGRQIYFTCKQYQADHHGKMPPSLTDLTPHYIKSEDARKWFSDPAHPESGENGWIYYGSAHPADWDGGKSALLVSKIARGGRNVVVHFDGSVTRELTQPDW